VHPRKCGPGTFALPLAYKSSMRTGLVVALVTLWLAPAAFAKLHISLSISNTAPKAHQSVRVLIRSEERPGSDCTMRLIAVALGPDAFRAVGAFVNGTGSVPLRRLGFEPKVVRASATSWRATIRFPRAGRWRLVVPNECAPGYMAPFPASRPVVVG
jgi:hypothetical protein